MTFILKGLSGFALSTATPAAVTTSAQASASVKIEDIQALMTSFAQTISSVLTNHGINPTHQARPTPGNRACNFCGTPDHFIHKSALIPEYEHVEKIKKNIDDKVVLSTGSFIPSNILPGRPLKERVDEWYRLNPN